MRIVDGVEWIVAMLGKVCFSCSVEFLSMRKAQIDVIMKARCNEKLTNG